MNKVGIITFEKYEGRRQIGSSRIRGRWLAKYWDGAEIFKMGQKYDVVIYQKAYWVEHAKVFDGIKIFDLCDPDWMHYGYRTKQMIEEVDAITTSTEALAEAVRKFTNKSVICIPDRMDPEYHSITKVHEGDAKSVVWFGYSTNFYLLQPVIAFLDRLGLDLIVISDRDFRLPAPMVGKIELTNYKYNEDTVNDNIIKGDILLNPKGLLGKWKYKSNNKTLTAWSLGLPVATDLEELNLFISKDERIKEVEQRTKELKEKWDVKLSVEDFKDLISEISVSKKIDINTQEVFNELRENKNGSD